MNEHVNRSARTAFAAGVVISLLCAPAWSQPTLREEGFNVRVFEGCANLAGPAFFGIGDAVCSAGGGFGEYVYYTVRFPEDESRDHIERINSGGRVETFGSGGPDFIGRLVLSPPESFAGERMIVNGVCDALSPQAVFTPEGAFEGCLGAGEGASDPSEFDRSGLFGFNWYSNTIFEVAVFDNFGSARGFAPSTGPGEVHFGPGGAWGRDLYVAGGGVVDPNGTLSVFPHAFSEWTWLDGPGWNGDMFDECGPTQICRVRPDGTVNLFASDVPVGIHLVGCGGDLWIMKAEECVRISPRKGKADTTITPSKVRLASDGGSFSIRTVLTDADTGVALNPDLMGPAWISSLTSPSLGQILTPVPRAEPGCNDATEDGIWETIESRGVAGSGTTTLKFNTPSDGSCETRDGDRGDIIPLLLSVPGGEAVSICFTAESSEVASPVEGCGFVTVQTRGGLRTTSAAREARQRRMDRKPNVPKVRQEAP